MGDFLGLFGDDKSNDKQGNQTTNSENQMSDSENQMSDSENQTSDSENQMTNSENQMTNSEIQTDSNGILQLHKEELDITKNNVNAGEVVLSKDIVEEQKTVNVPVMHEEVVIKRTKLNNNEKSDNSVISEESIHIPVTQEQIEVNKYTVATEEISASTRQVQETQQVQETLKHEEAHVDTVGSVFISEGASDFEDINNK